MGSNWGEARRLASLPNREKQTATLYLEAIKRDPSHTAAHYSLAQLCQAGARGRRAAVDAGLCAAKGLRAQAKAPAGGGTREPRDPQAAYELGLPPRVRARAKSGEVFEKILKLNPSFEGAEEKLDEIERAQAERSAAALKRN